jgi:diacylglycerol kinase (ATP)
MITFLRARLASFRPAFRGALILVKSQHNARVHLVATILVVALGLIVELSSGEWLAIILAVGMVWCAEALNTSIELLGDEIALEHRPRIGKAKDIAAFAVLAAAFTAAVIGVLVFARHMT